MYNGEAVKNIVTTLMTIAQLLARKFILLVVLAFVVTMSFAPLMVAYADHDHDDDDSSGMSSDDDNDDDNDDDDDEDEDEDEDESEDDEDDDSCDTSDDSGLSELEADIFTNETVVKIELDGDKDVLVLDDSADTEEEIVDAVLDEYSSLTRSEVEDAIVVEEEDRASRASDKDWADAEDDSCDDEDGDHHGRGNGDDDEDDLNEDDSHHGLKLDVRSKSVPELEELIKTLKALLALLMEQHSLQQ